VEERPTADVVTKEFETKTVVEVLDGDLLKDKIEFPGDAVAVL
jgi:hypothetical protein